MKPVAALLLATSLVACKAGDHGAGAAGEARGSGSAATAADLDDDADDNVAPRPPITGAPSDGASTAPAPPDKVRAGEGRLDSIRRPPRRRVKGGALGPRDAFAMRLLRALPTTTSNVAVAPVAMAAALAMVASTATGRSARELVQLLGLPDDDLLGTSLEPELERLPRGDDVRLANRLWIDGAAAGAPQAADAVKRLRGSLDRLTVSSDPSGARATIDRWVSQETGGAVTAFVPPTGGLQGCVLTSALAMDLVWKFAFDPARTTPTTFHGRTGSAPVPMMTLTAPMRAAAGADAVLVEVPLAQAGMVVWLAIPTSAAGVDAVAALDGDALERWADQLAPAVVALRLPRLTLAETLDLTPALRELGAETVFSAQAELPGLRASGAAAALGFNLGGNRRDRLGAVLHQSHVGWRETGRAPAPGLPAAAALDPEAPSLGATTPSIAALADRPFVFQVRDDQGTVLVAGRVVEPPA